MKIRILSSLEEAIKWDKYILTHEKSMFNSQILFGAFVGSLTKDTMPVYLYAEEAGEIKGVLPAIAKDGPLGLVLNSLPWYGSNPGCLASNQEAFSALIEAFFDWPKNRNVFSSTIISPPYPSNFNYYSSIVFLYRPIISDRIGMITNIEEVKTFEDVLEIVHPKTRNQIRRGAENCIVEIDNSIRAFAFLKSVHQENMTAVGAPYKDSEFTSLRKMFEAGTDYVLRVARERETGKLAAALLLKYFNKTVDYMTPAISVNYRSLNPLHCLIAQSMVEAAEAGFKFWNWGGTLPTGMDGVYHFKKRFGGVEHPYKYYTKIYKRIPKWEKERFLTAYPLFYVLPFESL